MINKVHGVLLKCDACGKEEFVPDHSEAKGQAFKLAFYICEDTSDHRAQIINDFISKKSGTTYKPESGPTW